MPAPSYSLPAIGSDNSVADPLVRTALSDLKTLLTDGLDEDNIDSINGSALDAGTVADAKLASPNNSAYRQLMAQSCFIGDDLAAGTYALANQLSFLTGALAGSDPVASGGSTYISGATTYYAPVNFHPIYFDDADYTVGSLTQKLRLRAQVSANATAWSSVTATFGLYPLTFAGTTDQLSITLGTVVSGSTVALANPGASATAQGNSGDFTIPSDGLYGIGFVTSATLTNNNMSLLTAQLQTRSV